LTTIWTAADRNWILWYDTRKSARESVASYRYKEGFLFDFGKVLIDGN